MPASNVFMEVLTAVYSLLSNDSAVMGLVTGVFQQPPTAQPFPYITIGNGQKYPWYQFQKIGASIVFQVDIWADIKDGDVDLLILGEVDRLLDGQTLAMNQYNNAQTISELAVYVPEETQEMRHIAARYRTYNDKK